jgi:hypothetical protein
MLWLEHMLFKITTNAAPTLRAPVAPAKLVAQTTELKPADSFEAKLITSPALTPRVGAYNAKLVSQAAADLPADQAQLLRAAAMAGDDNKLLNLLARAPNQTPAIGEFGQAVSVKVERDVLLRTSVLLRGRKPSSVAVAPALLEKLNPPGTAGAPFVKAVLEDFVARNPSQGPAVLQQLADTGFRFITNPAEFPDNENIKGGAMVTSQYAERPGQADAFDVTGHVIYLNPRRSDTFPNLASFQSVLANELTNALPIAEWHRTSGQKLPMAEAKFPQLIDLRQEVNGAVAEAQVMLGQQNKPITVQSTLEEIGRRGDSSNRLWLGPQYQQPTSLVESAVMYLGLVYGDQPMEASGVSADVMRQLNDVGLQSAVTPENHGVAGNSADELLGLATKARELARAAGYDPETKTGDLPKAQASIRRHLQRLGY